MKLFLGVLMALTLSAHADGKADKLACIRGIEQKTGFTFPDSGDSEDGKEIRWEFRPPVDPRDHGLPVIIDVPAFATMEQVRTAAIAAFAEVRALYLWMSVPLANPTHNNSSEPKSITRVAGKEDL
jgi:hypothetical protein